MSPEAPDLKPPGLVHPPPLPLKGCAPGAGLPPEVKGVASLQSLTPILGSGSGKYLTQLSPEYLDKKWQEAKKLPPFFPITIEDDVAYDVIAKLKVYHALGYHEGDHYDLRGVEVMAKPLRHYPMGDLMSPTLGYVREVSAKELSGYQKKYPGYYRLGDLVGANGLEKQWDPQLKGKDGYVQKVVDAVGREITTEDVVEFLRRERAVHGQHMMLTIDSRLQQIAENRFGDRAGGLVALNVSTGEILAFVSRPQFDPSVLVSHVTSDIWNKLVMDPGKPLLNRAYQAAYPPGSTYKIVTAIAGLEAHVVTPEEKIHCPGYLKFGNNVFRCWNSSGHGWMNLHDAIVRSCDVYFYTVGLRVGVDRLAQYANLLGLGKKTGIRLAGENAGLIPTQAWKERVRHEPWHPGENLSIAIGQGYDLVTPLQNALVVTQVANHGNPVSPYFVQFFEDPNGQKIAPPGEEIHGTLPIDKDHLTLIHNALIDVVNSPWGTARGSRLPEIIFGGKTGTSQVISERGKAIARMKGSPGNFEDHAWFVAFAREGKPEIAVAVLVEHGGHGSSAAAPIARDFIAEYYRLYQLDHETDAVTLEPETPDGQLSLEQEVESFPEAEADSGAPLDLQLEVF